MDEIYLILAVIPEPQSVDKNRLRFLIFNDMKTNIQSPKFMLTKHNLKSVSCFLLLSVFISINAKTQTEDSMLVVGSYKAMSNQQDSLNVFIKDSKWACIEYMGICKVNQTPFVSKNLIKAKNDNITKLIDALVYIKNKSIEWNTVLESHNIGSYEKEFKDAHFPRLNLDVIVQEETYRLWINKHLIKKACFVKNSEDVEYKIVLVITASGEVDHGWLRTLIIIDKIELTSADINKLISLLRDADKLCHETSNIDALLVE